MIIRHIIRDICRDIITDIIDTIEDSIGESAIMGELGEGIQDELGNYIEAEI